MILSTNNVLGEVRGHLIKPFWWRYFYLQVSEAALLYSDALMRLPLLLHSLTV